MMNARGFTIAELAVAVAIIAVLLFGAMIPFATQVDIRNLAETRRTMDSIKEAILGFAQANGRLPCPANGATADGTVDSTTWPTPVAAGAEQWNPIAKVCYTVLGVVPWATLGVAETDAWGRRLTYRVSPVFADDWGASTWSTTAPSSPADQSPACAPIPTPSAPASFALCTLGDSAVLTRTASVAVPVATALPAVFISHGKNGYGAWQVSGIRVSGPAAGTDEAANVNGGNPSANPGSYASWIFYSRNLTAATAGCADPAPFTSSGSPLCEFDDIVGMIPSNVLIARMVAAGKLP